MQIIYSPVLYADGLKVASDYLVCLVMPIITTKLCHSLHHYVENGSRLTEYVLIKQLKRRFIMKLFPNPLKQENNTGISLTLTK